jgi:hypothetical protein
MGEGVPLMRPKLWFRGSFGVVIIVALALVASPSAASGGELLAGCGARPLEQPFLPWLDPANYVLAPNGGFESGSGSWTLAGGATVVSGNESYRVHSSADTHALSLPAGSSATSSAVCVGLLDPTLRLFAANSGSPLSTLKVDVLYNDITGRATSATVGTLPGTASWQPTLPVAFLANLNSLPLVTNGTTSVAFRFTAQGKLGGWKIDDVYVDPYKGG